MTQRTTITSFDRRYLAAVAFSPLAGRIWLVHRSVLAEHGLDVVAEMASREGIEELAIHASQAADIGKTAQNARPKTGLYAVNDAAAIDRALAMGVPAFTTDRPDLAVAARDAAGAEPPRADALASAAN
jgi:glycerophosphoryl diester phosphodiesterase